MDMKRPSLLKAVTQARKHVTPESRAVARAIDARVRADVTEWQHEHQLWEVVDDAGDE